jgi:tetratricopeptide (TPR) repeat protein
MIFVRNSRLNTTTLLFLLIASGCSERKKENDSQFVLTGLDGKQYIQPERTPEAQAKLDSNLQVAKRNFETEPSEENYIWLGRREAYLYNYQQAIEIFSEGLTKYPDSYKLFRHRGHRYITMRDFPRAVADFQKAASLMPDQPLEIEPDGQPNKLNIPLSTTQFNVWYHLGLAHYLRGDFENAAKAYEKCMDVSNNDDLLCATADWLYMTYSRLNKPEVAASVLELVRDSMNIIENDSYYLRLQMYKGMLPPDDLLKVSSNSDVDLALATQGYGVGNWYLCEGDTTRAVEIFNHVTSGKHFAAFGFIAAEAELARLPELPVQEPMYE